MNSIFVKFFLEVCEPQIELSGSPGEPFKITTSTFSEKDKVTPMSYNTDIFWRPKPTDTNPKVLFMVNVPGQVTLLKFQVKSLYSKSITYNVLDDDKTTVLQTGVSFVD